MHDEIESWRRTEAADFRREGCRLTLRALEAAADGKPETARTLRNLARAMGETAERVERGEADHLRELPDA